MELKEQEKFLRIKKEVIKIIENKKEKLTENNIKVILYLFLKEYLYLFVFLHTITDNF